MERGARELRVSYISEVPIWKSTYRILFTDPKVAKCGCACGYSDCDVARLVCGGQYDWSRLDQRAALSDCGRTAELHSAAVSTYFTAIGHKLRSRRRPTGATDAPERRDGSASQGDGRDN